MRKNSYLSESDPPEPPATGPQVRPPSALHIILGLALLFLAGTLLVHMVEKFRQTGLGFTVFVSLLGCILFCIVGGMLLSSELRRLISYVAEKRRSRRSVDHGQQ